MTEAKTKQPPLQKFLPIVGLRHETSPGNAIGILERGFFTWRENLQRGVQITGLDKSVNPNSFPGVYFLAVLPRELGKPLVKTKGEVQNDVSIIVDPYILNRYDYHVNQHDRNGYILPGFTASHPTLALYLQRVSEEIREGQPLVGEIVFHNHVPASFIKAIGVKTPQDSQALKKQLVERKLEQFVPLLTTTLFEDKKSDGYSGYYETNQDVLHSNTDYALLAEIAQQRGAGVGIFKPAFCYADDEPLYWDDTDVIKMARNCGISAASIRDTLCKDATSLKACRPFVLQEIARLNKGNLRMPTHHEPVVYWPPIRQQNFTSQDQATIIDHFAFVI